MGSKDEDEGYFDQNTPKEAVDVDETGQGKNWHDRSTAFTRGAGIGTAIEAGRCGIMKGGGKVKLVTKHQQVNIDDSSSSSSSAGGDQATTTQGSTHGGWLP